MLDQAMLDRMSTAALIQARDQIDATIANSQDTYPENDDAPFPNPRPVRNPIPIGIDVAINDKVRLVEGISPKYLSGAVVQVTGFSGGGQPLARILTQKAGYKTFRLNPKYIAEVVAV
jgi:hypothetical protein